MLEHLVNFYSGLAQNYQYDSIPRATDISGENMLLYTFYLSIIAVTADVLINFFKNKKENKLEKKLK